MYIDRLVLLFIVGGYFLSPFVMEWASEGGTQWYRPYAVWLMIIALGYWITRSRDLDGL